jgi:hypothetical protein
MPIDSDEITPPPAPNRCMLHERYINRERFAIRGGLADGPSVGPYNLHDSTRLLLALLVRVMMRLAQGLPVGPVPHQDVITSMGNLVVNHLGSSHSPFSAAHAAQHVLGPSKEDSALSLPPGAIAALCRLASVSSPAGLLGHRSPTMKKAPTVSSWGQVTASERSRRRGDVTAETKEPSIAEGSSLSFTGTAASVMDGLVLCRRSQVARFVP